MNAITLARRVVRDTAKVGTAVRMLVSLEFSPTLPPWSRLPADQSTVGELRRLAPRTVRAVSGFGPVASLLLGAVSVWWPARATWDATSGAMRHGPRVKAQCGIGRFGQWRDSMGLAHFSNLSPRSYYLYRLWDPAVRLRAASYVQVHEMTVFQVQLNREVDTRTLADKELFTRQCGAHGIATPPLVATLRPSREDWAGTPGELPPCDLFVKLVWGKQGSGAERWVHDHGSGSFNRQGRYLTPDELLDRCRGRARWRQVMIQRCLTNHADIARFSTGSLCTFRVMTYLDAAGTPTLLGLTLKMARDGSDVDNLHAGGLVCAVDPDSGTVSPGRSQDPTEPPQNRHPDTHEQVAGALLETHRYVIDLALRAHAALDVPWSVGWDVAMTPDGPVLVEGNPGWGIDLFHVPHAAGLPDHFATALLERVSKTTNPPARRA